MVNTGDDVIIKLGMNIVSAQEAIKTLRKELAASFSDMNARKISESELALKKLKDAYTQAYNAPKKAQQDALKAMQKEQALQQSYSRQLGQISAQYGTKFAKNVEAVAAKMRIQAKESGMVLGKMDSIRIAATKLKKLNLGETFQGWALSFLMFGMQLSQTMQSIWRSSTKTFQDIMHSVDGTVTNVDYLNGSMQYLGFVVGQALEPIAAILAPIIEKFAEWIENNQGLAMGLFVLAFVLGKVFTWGGGLILIISGIVQLMTLLSIKSALAAAGLGAVGTTAKAGFWATFVGNIKKLWLGFKSMAIWVWANAIPLLIIIGLVAAIIALAYSLRYAWDNVWAGVGNNLKLMAIGFQIFVKQVEKGWVNVKYSFKVFGMTIKFLFAEVVNFLIGAFNKLLNSVIWTVNQMIAVANYFGAGFKPISYLATDNIIDTSGFERDMSFLLAEWADTWDALEQEQRDLELSAVPIEQAQAINAAEGWADWKKGMELFWEDLIAMFTGKSSELTNLVPNTGDIISDEGAGDTYIDNSIEMGDVTFERMDGETDEDFIERMLRQIRISQETVTR